MLVGLLILWIIVAGVILIVTVHNDGIKDRRRELGNLAFMLAEQTERDFRSLYILRDDIDAQMEMQGVSDAASLAARFGTEAFHRQLSEKVSALPHLGALALVDQAGRLLNSSRHWPIPDTSVANAAYFHAFGSARIPSAFVGAPLRHPVSGTLVIHLALPLITPQGSFLGGVVATLEQSYFEAMFSALDLGTGGLIVLVRDDGALLAGYPMTGVADSAPTAARAALFSQTQAGDVPAGVLDGTERIAGVRRVDNLPLAVVVSDSMQAINAELLRRITPIAVATCFICLSIALVSHLMMRGMKGTQAFADAQHRAARSDPLTGLGNRLGFAEKLDRMAGGPGPATPFALLFLDLDNFKSVNDTLGHVVGDDMLVLLAGRLRSALPAAACVARIGGDEFALIYPGVVAEAEALKLARDLIEQVRVPLTVGGHRLVARCSIGVVLSPRDGADAVTLLRNADLALYRAKAQERGTALVFEEAMERGTRERRALELDLRIAWRDHQFHVMYQPIFEACSGGLAGFEALVRWRHPKLGNVSPDIFIPMAEQNGLILPLGKWVLGQACRAAAEWPAPLTVSVNLSPSQFRGAQAFQQVRAALAESGLAPERLEIEITESTLLMEGPVVHATLDQFHAEGISVALDDFGTGYSSLRYLRTLRIGRIKVDQSFVREVETSADSRAIIEAVTNLARALRLRCTAEGIETEAQRAFMVERGCSHLQGFLLGRPCTPEEALRLARTAGA